VFDGLEKKAKIQRARILLDKTYVQKSDFERGMTLEVKNSRIAYLNAQESVSTTEKSLQLAQNIYDTTQIKFREGVGSSLEVAQAERELYTAQANYTNALYELLVAKADLDKAQGK
ncbi:MAG TPA: TolC family protein, partial [Saprospiraceae bacterium]|nr:TolC family protein [Saprospiraceae bacterium]